ncbi:MAG: hypothetical protein K0S79_126, partial [Nitrospira sp.]|nr:hypothetical protein [Nitrospira sp.]
PLQLRGGKSKGADMQAVMNGSNSMVLNQQWSSRPDDQRYLSLSELENAVRGRKDNGYTIEAKCAELRAVPSDSNTVTLLATDKYNNEKEMKPTNWAFGQLASYAGAPASYLRKLPAELACINLQYGLERLTDKDERGLILGYQNGSEQFRAMTSPTYGRIWDLEVVQAVQRVNQDGRWQVPAASYAHSNPKRATTLYASDRDVFVFLCDPNTAIEAKNGQVLYRGFYVWNSEVGAATFGLATFLYNHICDNRIIWGMQNHKELTIRHTGGAPERFGWEGRKYLTQYAQASAALEAERINKAIDMDLPVKHSINDKEHDKNISDWLQKRGFTSAVASASIDRAKEEEGGVRSLWDIVQGVTAYARGIQHTDTRVDIERKAGKLMELVAS